MQSTWGASTHCPGARVCEPQHSECEATWELFPTLVLQAACCGSQTRAPTAPLIFGGCIKMRRRTWANLAPSLMRDEQDADRTIRQDAGSVSPSPRFAESAEQNGEWCQAEVRPGVRCFVLIPYSKKQPGQYWPGCMRTAIKKFPPISGPPTARPGCRGRRAGRGAVGRGVHWWLAAAWARPAYVRCRW